MTKYFKRTINIREEELKNITKEASRLGVSIPEIVRIALERYFDKESLQRLYIKQFKNLIEEFNTSLLADRENQYKMLNDFILSFVELMKEQTPRQNHHSHSNTKSKPVVERSREEVIGDMKQHLDKVTERNNYIAVKDRYNILDQKWKDRIITKEEHMEMGRLQVEIAQYNKKYHIS